MNEVARWITSSSMALRKNEKGDNIDKSMLSPWVAPPGLEPAQLQPYYQIVTRVNKIGSRIGLLQYDEISLYERIVN